MINKKLLYEQPDCELLVVRFEGEFLTGTNDGKGGIQGFSQDHGNVIDDTDGWGI